MILDTSAIVAVVAREPGSERLYGHVNSSDDLSIGGPTLVETGMVLAGRFGTYSPSLTEFLEEFEVGMIPFGEHHWREALRAFERFGKGRHPAGLNFGDCLTYAVAYLAREPLLCVGDDFAQTDLELVDLSA